MGDLISRGRLLKHIAEWQRANTDIEHDREYRTIDSCHRMVKYFPKAFVGGSDAEIKSAIRILHPNTTAEALDEIDYYGGFNGKEAQIKAIEKACLLACEIMTLMVGEDNEQTD